MEEWSSNNNSNKNKPPVKLLANLEKKYVVYNTSVCRIAWSTF